MDNARDKAIAKLYGNDFSEKQWAGFEIVTSVVRSHFPHCDVYIANNLAGRTQQVRFGKFNKKKGNPLFGIVLDRESQRHLFRIVIASRSNRFLRPNLGSDHLVVCNALNVKTWNDVTSTVFYLDEIDGTEEIDAYVAKFKEKLPEWLLKKRTEGLGRMPADFKDTDTPIAWQDEDFEEGTGDDDSQDDGDDGWEDDKEEEDKDWDDEDDVPEEEDLIEGTNEGSSRKRTPARINRARSDATAGTIRAKIEKAFGLPEGSVALLNPDKSKPNKNLKIGSLRRRWKEAGGD